MTFDNYGSIGSRLIWLSLSFEVRQRIRKRFVKLRLFIFVLMK
jgi:hypothetical protein